MELKHKDEIIIDEFAGGGGASTGIELATGRAITIAVNHDPDAILLHRTNHPFTKHLQESVWDVDPVEVCAGRPVGLAWFSPDCFEAGTLVLTSDGYKPIESVREGDLVLTHKMRWRKVTATMKTERDEMVIKGYGHPGIVCSTGHPFYVRHKANGFYSSPEWKKAKDLTNEDFWGSPVLVDKLGVPDFENYATKVNDLMWASGDYIRNSQCWKDNGSNVSRWVKNNFRGSNGNLIIPGWVFGLDYNLKDAFLEGYIGCDWHFENDVNIAIDDKAIAYSIRTMIVTMGYAADITIAEDGQYIVSCSKSADDCISDDILWSPIRDCVTTGNRKFFYNISVEEDESYVAEGLIVHNCKHFSKAKGAALVDKNIRGLAWVVVKWAESVRPRVIMLENVEEFQTWGPVGEDKKPIKELAGTTFIEWKQRLIDLGYDIDYKVLTASDYGAPTSRKRFVFIARCDGKPIVWPKPTHGDPNSEEVKSGKLLPYKTAADIIDWSLPGYSIFDTKQQIKEKFNVTAVRPLADNTMRRIIRGVDKFTIKSGNPFIVDCNHGGEGHIWAKDKPVATITGKAGIGVCKPIVTPVNGIRSANLIQYHTEQTESARVSGLRAPINTIDASNRYGLACANLVEYYGNGVPLDLTKPLHTVTSHDREAFVSAHIAEFKGQDVGQNVDRPLRTITTSAGEFGVCKTVLMRADPDKDYGYWPRVRELLNKYCDYNISDKEILLLVIGGVPYYISDITLRMLSPRELYNAMGFPSDYIIDRDYKGNAYGKTKQVARCGNAVCPPMAEAVVRANLPEWCGQKFDTMEDLHKAIA